MLVTKAQFKDRRNFLSIRLNSQEQYMLGTLVKMRSVPKRLHPRLNQAMDDIQVTPVAREVAQIFMGVLPLKKASDPAHDLYKYLRIWAGKEDRVPAA